MQLLLGAKLVRSVRRLIPSEKYSKALFDTVRGTPWSLRGDGVLQPLTTAQLPAQAGGVPSAQADAGSTDTTNTANTAETQTDTTNTGAAADGPAHLSSPAAPPTTTLAVRPALPAGPASTTKRDFADSQPSERPDKLQRKLPPTTTLALPAPLAGDKRTTGEAGLTLDARALRTPKTRRVATLSLRSGEEVRVSVNEDTEPTTVMYDTPYIYDPGDFPPEELSEAMMHEMASMRHCDVFEEATITLCILPWLPGGCTGGRATQYALDSCAVASLKL